MASQHQYLHMYRRYREELSKLGNELIRGDAVCTVPRHQGHLNTSNGLL